MKRSSYESYKNKRKQKRKQKRETKDQQLVDEPVLEQYEREDEDSEPVDQDKDENIQELNDEIQELNDEIEQLEQDMERLETMASDSRLMLAKERAINQMNNRVMMKLDQEGIIDMSEVRDSEIMKRFSKYITKIHEAPDTSNFLKYDKDIMMR